MSKNKAQTGFKYYWAIDLAVLLAIGIGALLLRILPNQETVFGAGWINLQGNDAWYHVRLIENMLQHFPQRITFDPYTYFPNGQEVFFAPFFDILIGFFAWVIGLGAPSQHTIEMVAAYAPPVLGVLTVIPVYFIGKTLFNRNVGLIAALIMVFLPSMFFVNTLLAQVDHHVAEILFSSISLLFLLLALKSGKAKELSFTNFITQKKQLLKPLIYAALCGIILGLYLMTWVGGLLFVLLYFCFFILMFIIDYLKNRSTDYLSIISIPVFFIPLLMVISFYDVLAYASLEVVALVAGTAVLPILTGISRFTGRLHLKKFYFFIFAVALASIAVLAAYLIDPEFVRRAISRFNVITPDANTTIAEVQPLFTMNGKFSLVRFWGYFSIPGILAVIAFIIFLIKTIRNITGERVLVLIWFLVTFIASAGQNRFTEYLTIAVVVFSASFIWNTIDFIPKIWNWLKLKLNNATTVSRKKKQRFKPPEQTRSIAFRSIHCVLAVVIIFLLGVFTNIKPALNLADDNQGTNRFWHDALTWMKANTPEPFGDADFYYELYDTPSDDQYDYPDSAYGILSWWSYGHIITQVAHRIPNANPHQYGASAVAHYLLQQDEERADRSINRLGARYLMIDITMALPDNPYMSRFSNVATWAGKDLYDFADVYYRKNGDKWEGIILYYPEYYETMMVRLYNFNGAAVTPSNSSIVISYKTESGRKLIQSMKVFPTYREASNYLNSQTTDNFRLVGTNPLASPVPLAKLDKYQRVYQSDAVTVGNKQISYIKVFEYIP